MSDGIATIRPAVVDEYPELTDLARRSKAHWGYGDNFLEACEEGLTVAPDSPRAEPLPVWVAEVGDELVGFYGLRWVDATTVELDYLFVEPDRIGKGHGRKLMEHAKRSASGMGGKTLLIHGDPHAEKFYLAAGGVRVGIKATGNIPGRELPVYQIPLLNPT